VKGFGDLIVGAETEVLAQACVYAFLSGHLARSLTSGAKKLNTRRCLLEVSIDSLNEDVPVDVSPEVTALLTAVNADISKRIAGYTTPPNGSEPEV